MRAWRYPSLTTHSQTTMLTSSQPPPTTSTSSELATDPSTDDERASFHVLLDADSAIDEHKLRRAASKGIPSEMRPIVWRMLLGLSAFSSSNGLVDEQKRCRDYKQLAAGADAQLDADAVRKIRNVLKRSRNAYQPIHGVEKRAGRQGSTSGESYDGGEEDDEEASAWQQPLPQSNGAVKASGKTVSYVHGSQSKLRVVGTEVIIRFTRVIATYLRGAGKRVEFHADMVYLCAPFVELMPLECDAYYAFHALMQRHEQLFCEEGLQDAVSQFITMFRVLHPDLHDHFISEEVDLKLCVAKWLRGLFVQQLPREYLLRLWDSYFANLGNQGLDLHPFVCLVFMENIKAELQECDDGERIISLLGKLRPLDIDYAIAHALTIRAQLRERDIL